MASTGYLSVGHGVRGARFGLRFELEPLVRGEITDFVGGLAVYDVESGERIDSIGAGCQPMLRAVTGEQLLLLAGTANHPRHEFTAIRGNRYTVAVGELHGVTERGWISDAIPFCQGMEVVVKALDGAGHELFRMASGPMYAERLKPMDGPADHGYAPIR